MKQTKLQQKIQEKIKSKVGIAMPIVEAIDLLKSLPKAKFEQSLDVSFNLGVDMRKSDQTVRGVSDLPAGNGKKSKVAVFADGADAEAATAAGADAVGTDDLAEKMQQGDLDWTVVIATPSTMKFLGKLGKILGPKGLMPNPKLGTVTQDVGAAVKRAKAGQFMFRAEKGGIVHGSIGKLNFENASLLQNLDAVYQSLLKAKPSTSKGVYVKKVVLSSTMGPGLEIDKGDLSKLNVN